MNYFNNVGWFALDAKGSISNPKKFLEKKAAIYIYQYIDDKMIYYIGSANNLSQRFRQHKYRVNKNIKSCPKFYNYVLKYGWDKFRYGILEYIDLNKDIISREQFYLDTLRPILNINKIAGSMLGYKHTKASIELMRACNPGYICTEEIRLKIAINNSWTQPVIVVNNNTGEINKLVSIRKASEFIGKNNSYIAKCLKKSKFYKNNIFTIYIY